jgi:hypothetical protein
MKVTASPAVLPSPAGHNLSQGPLRNMFTAGITWALEDPASRALFLPTCLGPFTAKLAAAEAGQVAGQLQQQLAAAEAALQSGEAAAEDEEALEELRGFLKALQVCGSTWFISDYLMVA